MPSLTRLLTLGGQLLAGLEVREHVKPSVRGDFTFTQSPVENAVLLGVLGADPHLRRGVDLADVGVVAQRAVVEVGDAALGEQ